MSLLPGRGEIVEEKASPTKSRRGYRLINLSGLTLPHHGVIR